MLKTSRRVEGQIITKKIVYGSHATMNNRRRPEDPATHKWTVYVRGLDNEDISHFIQSVEFVLHHSFEIASRVCDAPPYEVNEVGWGEFEIKIRISFPPEAAEPPLELSHTLKLHASSSQQSALGTGMRPTPLPPRKGSVVVEKFDEILFVEPTEPFYRMLTAGPPATSAPQPTSESGTGSTRAYRSLEATEVARLEEARVKLKAHIARLADKLEQAEESLAQYTGDPTCLTIAPVRT